MGTIRAVFSLLLHVFQAASFGPRGYLEARLGISRLNFFLEASQTFDLNGVFDNEFYKLSCFP